MKLKSLVALQLSAVLCTPLLPVHASNYYIVMLGSASDAHIPTISVNLGSIQLPEVVYANVYPGFDFDSVLQVTGDPNYDASQVTWSVISGALPPGLVLNADGTLTGMTSLDENSIVNFQVQASYRGTSSAQSYSLTMVIYPAPPNPFPD